MQVKSNAFAYQTYGEARFEDLCVIFAPSVVEVVMLSSDEEIPNEKDDDAVVIIEESKHAARRHLKGKMVDITSPFHTKNRRHPKIVHARGKDGGPSKQPFMHGAPNHGLLNAHPAVPKPSSFALDKAHVSPGPTKTPPYNIWDPIPYFSDDDSAATYISTANSFNCGARGIRSQPIPRDKWKKNHTKGHFSATDSWSPNPKQ